MSISTEIPTSTMNFHASFELLQANTTTTVEVDYVDHPYYGRVGDARIKPSTGATFNVGAFAMPSGSVLGRDCSGIRSLSTAIGEKVETYLRSIDSPEELLRFDVRAYVDRCEEAMVKGHTPRFTYGTTTPYPGEEYERICKEATAEIRGLERKTLQSSSLSSVQMNEDDDDKQGQEQSQWEGIREQA